MIDVQTINKVVAEACRKTGIPRETMEKCWVALCHALEPYVRAKVDPTTTYSGKAGKA